MGEALLRIGEFAARAGVSTRTVDFYTSLGLLVPARRTDGNFRLYHPGDVTLIGLIRRLEGQGIRLEDIARALAPSPDLDARSDTAGQSGRSGGEGASTDPTTARDSAEQAELRRQLASLEEQVKALHQVADVADPRTRGLLATLTARAQAMIMTAVVLGSELAGEVATELEHFHPL